MAHHRFIVTLLAPAEEPRQALEVVADEIGHVHDGTVSWLNFHDGAGEVLRLRSEAVERVDRVR